MSRRGYIRNRRRILDVTQPINWQHPINAGLVADWTISPNSGWRGGAYLRDIVRGGRLPNDGTLTNSPPWRGSRGRSGGFGSIDYASGNGGFSWAAFTYQLPASNWTMAAWFNSPGANDGGIVGIGSVGNTDKAVWMEITAAGNFKFGYYADDVGAGWSASNTLNTWCFGAMTFNSSLLQTGYVNGLSVGTHTSTGSYSGDNSGRIGFGRQPAGNPSNAIIDSVLIYNRVLSADEIMALYVETRAGNPRRLRWIASGRKFSVAAPVAGSFNAARCRNTNVFQGFGGRC